MQDYQKEGNRYVFPSSSGILLEVRVISDEVIRFRYSRTGAFEDDFSYAIDESVTFVNAAFSLEVNPESYWLKTRSIKCQVIRKNLQCRIFSLDDTLICEDSSSFSWEYDKQYDCHKVWQSKCVQIGESFWGLGDKPTEMNLRGKQLQNWNTDYFGYLRDDDPVYRSIPFYMGLHSGIGYGIFFDNSHRTHFDFGKSYSDTLTFGADAGELCYYFIAGPALLDVIKRYTHLTGKPELPPMWSLGYHQSKWSYFPESTVRELAESIRAHRIPCDALYLDIDYMDKFRCFTWHSHNFPTPKAFLQELDEMGFKTVVIIDPGVKVDPNYWVYTSGLEADAFCKQKGEVYLGHVWPGECAFPDFTKPSTREWWAGLFEDIVSNVGVNGIWNDMNEPAVFHVESKTMPDEVEHDYDGRPCDHRKAHNIYGSQMARASLMGHKRFQYPNRPFVITRAGYAGIQRYACVWTGDNTTSWDHLHLANIQCQRMSISGVSFVGADIGGFSGQPDGELYVRWLQLAVFHSFCRTHFMGYNEDGAAAVDEYAKAPIDPNLHQEPWTFGDWYTDIARETIELRYRLMPYLYTAFWRYTQDGSPMIKPLVVFDQQDEQSLMYEAEFIFGEQMLVVPIIEPDLTQVNLYLPQGQWYNFHSHTAYEGGQDIWEEVTMNHIPIFVKAGAVIPMYPVMQYTGEKSIDVLQLHVYYVSGKEESELYEDAGDGYTYQDGEYLHTKWVVEGGANSLSLTQSQEGDFQASYKWVKLYLHGLPFQATSCEVDGKAVYMERTDQAWIVRAQTGFESLRIIGVQ